MLWYHKCPVDFIYVLIFLLKYKNVRKKVLTLVIYLETNCLLTKNFMFVDVVGALVFRAN